MKSKPTWKEMLFENLNYKVVSLFIALILWSTIMLRRDLSITRKVDLDFKTAAVHKIVGQTADQVHLRLSGESAALNELNRNERIRPLLVDITDRPVGTHDIEIPVNRIDLPPGVRIISVRPNLVRVEIGAIEAK